jgi:hypothetical protein
MDFAVLYHVFPAGVTMLYGSERIHVSAANREMTKNLELEER